ncbi:membrane-associating domain-containing protein [Daldinia caldariorum]|uniref:membrane-associating domain-containing protein n=1 Tax=Daldinia caldariorum TaxID=326644 RepID=UPI0020089F1C|nr:membrane-associating domain-containing protein [Daldinia caldariorum]KAI1471533.1 membrane-associating domain-containing protein [Daldinia caldariorum]
MTTTTHRDARFPNRIPRITAAQMNSNMITLGIRAAQLVFGIILLGLTGYVAHWYNVDTLTSSPSQINLLLFSSLLTILSVFYLELAARFVPKISHPLAALGLIGLNAILHFAGFIALAVFMSRLLFCRGSVCGSARASIAFGAIEFLLWTASAVFAGKEVVQGGGFLPKRGAKSQSPLRYPSEMKESAPPA